MFLILLVLILVVIGLLVAVLHSVRTSNMAYVNLEATTSLAEVVESLDRAAKHASRIANELEINIAEARQQFSRLVVLLDRLQTDVTATSKSGARVEADQVHVAEELAALQQQARDSEVGAPGTIADAAAGGIATPEKSKPKSKSKPKPKSS